MRAHVRHGTRTSSLVWDGVERIANFAARYLGAEDTQYHRAVSRCLFIAAVARIMRPGCKADYVPILEGAQDKGKSTAIELLFTPWFSDDLAELGTKDAAMQVRVAWGIEIAELASMTQGRDRARQSFHHPQGRSLPPKLWPARHRSSAPERFHRQHQQRRLPEGRNGWPSFLADPLRRQHRSEGHRTRPRPALGGSGSAV